MHATRIVTSFLTDEEKILILKRSRKVKTMKELWAGISGIIENDEEPLERAKIEIYEEVSIPEIKITLKNSADCMTVKSPQYKNHEWKIFPFLFSVQSPQIKLNWENTDYKWIKPADITKFETVPSLREVLFNLL